jgi:hypothetical protein
MVIAVIVVLAVVVYVAMGHGGELSAERNDYVPLDLGPVSATDVVLLRPPTGLWGYNMQATDEAMEQVAESIRERDVRIVALEQLVTDLSRDHDAPMPLLASPYEGARHRRAPVDPAETEAVQAPHEAPATPYEATETPYQAPETEAARLPFVPREAPETQAGRLPFVPRRPSGDFAGPPERSHD